MTGLAGGIGIDVAAFQEVVEAADPIPSVAVAFQHQRVSVPLISVAVILGQQIDQKLAGLAGKPGSKENSRGFSSKLCTNSTELLRQS